MTWSGWCSMWGWAFSSTHTALLLQRCGPQEGASWTPGEQGRQRITPLGRATARRYILVLPEGCVLTTYLGHPRTLSAINYYFSSSGDNDRVVLGKQSHGG